MRLTGKTALVTGSTTGIGEAIARAFGAAGAEVVVHGLERADGERVADEITAAGPGRARFVPGDLERPEDCRALVERAADRFRLDIVVNNAALKHRDGLEDLTADGFDRTLAINLRAPVLLAQAALPWFRRAGGGVIINIGSMNAYCGEPRQLSYAISKAGLMTMCRNLADAHGRERIRCHHFNVGWVLSANEHALKISEGLPPDWDRRIPPEYAPAGRLLTPAEVAHFVLAFAVDDAALVNGTVLDLEQFPLIGRVPPRRSDQFASATA